jgi:hypothetical protein
MDLAQPFKEALPDAQRIRHDSQRRINRAARGKEASIYDIKIIEVMRFAIDV